MSKRLADDRARLAIETALDRNLFVEAAAGTGKTRSLVDRMVAIVREGRAPIERLSAVTFTVKAAAELSERFQVALEKKRRIETDPERRLRFEQALTRLDRCFVGTIHAFCARLLRERPVEAGVDPEFEEMDETENLIAREEAWESYTHRLFVEESPLLSRLSALGVPLEALEETYNALADNTDVEPASVAQVEPPDFESVRRALEEFLPQAAAELPAAPPRGGWDSFQRHLREALRLMRAVEDSRPSSFARVLESLDSTAKATKNRWPRPNRAVQLAEEFDRLRCARLKPALSAWREHLYPILIAAIRPAVSEFTRRRLEAGRLNFQDLLLFARDLLRNHPDARRDFQSRFTPILVDEFQDTDPIQAEVLLFLTGRDLREKNWRGLEPIPGSLFVVGDPKQSIYRFRRADIETYERVRKRIVESGGEVVTLTSNFRSSESICGWVNRALVPLFPPAATREQAAYAPLSPSRERDPEEPCGAFRLEVPALAQGRAVACADAKQIADWIRAALDGATLPLGKSRGKHVTPRRKFSPGDFLILLRYRRHLRLYARALEARRIPYEITGGGAFADSEEIAALLPFLEALIDPDNPVPLVAALRGDLFGIDDRTLYEFRCAGGRFSFLSDPPPGSDPRLVRAWGMLREARAAAGKLPPGAALATIVEQLGLTAAAGAEELGETNAGNLLKALTLARTLSCRGETFADIVGQLRALTQREEIEEMSTEPGRSGVVRLMNLHRAKGLEAPVVFLADPTGGQRRNITWSVDRRKDPAEGYFRITTPRGAFETVEIAHPRGWDEMAASEERFYEAEEDRLLYVAATRAEDLLVVSVQTKDGRSVAKGPWTKLIAHLTSRLPEFALPLATPLPAPWTNLESQRESARQSRQTRLAASSLASYEVTQVTAVSHAAGPAPAREITGRGLSWGRVLHRLLEAMMRDGSLDIRAYAANLLAEEEREPGDLEEVVRLAQGVRSSSLWLRALASPRRLVEVPFALMIPAEELGKGEAGQQTLLQGAIDLAFEEEDGWVVVDYKSDTVSGNLAQLVDFYSPQIAHYRRYWERLTGRKTKAGLYFVQTGEEVWLD